jgi:rod shape determining protein RodA
MRHHLLFGADREVDSIYAGIVLGLSLLGVLLIFSARHSVAGTESFHLRQLLWLLLSVAAFLVVIRLPLRFYEVFAYPILGIALALLAALFVVGHGAGGAVRWFNLGQLKFQPSEWAKLAVVIAASRYLSTARTRSPLVKLLVLGAICGVPALMILRQPDLGTALVFAVIFLGMAVWAQIPLWAMAIWMTPLLSLVAASNVYAWLVYFALLILILAWLRPNLGLAVTLAVLNLAGGIATPILWGRLHDYQKMRVLTFLDPERDPHGSGYQIIQSKIAIGAGGLAGKGFLSGSQTHLKFLPAQHTDFVFAVLGEEFGFWGTTLVIALFAALVLRGYFIAARARNRFGSYLAAGITTILLFHVLVNIGMTVGLFPVTGIPLPFLSYGGSFLLAMWVLAALVVSVSDRWQEY